MNEPVLDTHKLRAKDEATLERMVEYLIPLIREFSHHHGVTEIEADDIVSDVLVYLLKDLNRLADLAENGHLTAFCKIYTRNTLIHRLRHAQKLGLNIETITDKFIDAEARNDDTIEDNLRFLEKEIERLSPKSRIIIDMYLRGLTTTEIAESLRISASAVHVHLHRIRQKLRSAVQSDKEGQ